MTGYDLRPLSTGEILDRTFSLYRSHFLLFLGISGIPTIPVLGFGLVRIMLTSLDSTNLGMTVLMTGISLILTLIAYLFSQGATIFAVSELYLGRTASIGGSLTRVRQDIGFLFGVILLNGLAVGGATLLLIIPGVYLACRLLVCVPAALIEGRGPSDSLSRSFDLTQGYAMRAFVILLVSVVITWATQLLLAVPFTIAMLISKDPAMMRLWLMLTQIGSSISSVLVGPVLLIATSVFYYDLRVRKEAFDLQILMDPGSEGRSRPSGTSILS